MTHRSFKTECLSLTFAALAISVLGFTQAPAVQATERVNTAAETIHVPTLKDNMPAGTIVTKEDIAWTDVPAYQVGQNIITNPQNLIGMATAWSLAGNRPIRNSDVRPPILAKKGTLITMTVTTPHMILSATGRALENGALGDTIRLVNTSTNKTVEGTVMADGNVTISRGIRTASLQR